MQLFLVVWIYVSGEDLSYFHRFDTYDLMLIFSLFSAIIEERNYNYRVPDEIQGTKYETLLKTWNSLNEIF